ncbi:MAG: hypothetical protein NVS4B2_14000 [Chloroflexota bacterium]
MNERNDRHRATEVAPAATDGVKSCCAAVYETEWARLLLGDSFHPGGSELTERLGCLLRLEPGMLVVDAACGRGDSALYLARSSGCQVIGIDLGAGNVAAATEAAAAQSLGQLVEFRTGDVESLPIEDATVDAVICECAFCTFPDKRRAAAEFSRVLRPGGVVGLSDVTRSGELSGELTSLLAWIACIADARPVDEYRLYLGEAGFTAGLIEHHDEALHQLVNDIRVRLLGMELLVKIGNTNLPFIDFEQAGAMAKVASQAVRSGQLGYSLMTATR